MQFPPPRMPHPPRRLVRKGRFWRTMTGPDSGAFWNGVILALWGAWLLMPADSYAVSEAFDFMEKVAPEWVWGLVMLVGGSVVISGVRASEPKLTWIGCWVAAVCFTVLTAAFAFGSLFSTATIVYGVLAVRTLLLTRKYWYEL